MVLFYDTEPKPKPTGKRKYFYRLLKVMAAFAILTWVSLWVLSTIGGNGNALRLGIQDYLSESTGYLAQISTLEKMSFFPVTHIAFQGATFHKPVEKAEKPPEEVKKENERQRIEDPSYPHQKGMADFFDAGDMVASVGSGVVSVDFWDMFFSRRRFHQFEVTDVEIEPGVWLPAALNLSAVKVVPDTDSPSLIAEGKYGAHKLDIKLKLAQVKDKRSRITYELPDETPIKIVLGPMTIDGTLHSASGQGVQLDVSNLVMNKVSLSGQIGMQGKGAGKRAIESELKVGNTHLNANLMVTPMEVTGLITASALDLQDIKTIKKAYYDIRDLLGLDSTDDRVSFSDIPLNVDMVIEKLVRDQQEWGNAKATIMAKPYMLEIKDVIGLINGGALKGDFIIDATSPEKEPSLKSEIHLRGWDYARLQNEVTGQADSHLTLSAQGQTFEALEKNLKGELVTIGGAGELTRNSVLYWGSGLLNTMLPDLSGNESLHMNCLVADFDIKGYTARTQTLFMDLKDLTIVGEGQIDLDDLTIDMDLKPNPKEISILDGGVTVNVSGPLARPEIESEAFSVAKKLGGLFLGTINPAFFALSLTDLGLNEAHPCSAYLKK